MSNQCQCLNDWINHEKRHVYFELFPTAASNSSSRSTVSAGLAIHAVVEARRAYTSDEYVRFKLEGEDLSSPKNVGNLTLKSFAPADKN